MNRTARRSVTIRDFVDFIGQVFHAQIGFATLGEFIADLCAIDGVAVCIELEPGETVFRPGCVGQAKGPGPAPAKIGIKRQGQLVQRDPGERLATGFARVRVESSTPCRTEVPTVFVRVETPGKLFCRATRLSVSSRNSVAETVPPPPSS